MPAKNYASETLKKIKSTKNKNTEIKYMSESDKKNISTINFQKEKLIEDRKKLIQEAKRKVKEIKDVENIDITKKLSKFKFLLPEKTSKKELNELIRKELAILKEKRKANKEEITKIEINESIIKSINIIYTKSKTPQLTEVYFDFVNYIEHLSRVQFGNNTYKKNLFKNEALKQIENQLQNSTNIEETVRLIFRKLSKI